RAPGPRRTRTSPKSPGDTPAWSWSSWDAFRFWTISVGCCPNPPTAWSKGRRPRRAVMAITFLRFAPLPHPLSPARKTDVASAPPPPSPPAISAARSDGRRAAGRRAAGRRPDRAGANLSVAPDHDGGAGLGGRRDGYAGAHRRRRHACIARPTHHRRERDRRG